MSNPTCHSSMQLCALRIAELTASGGPNTGATNGYVTTAAITLNVDVEVSTGDEFEQKNGCGDICATYKAPDRIKRVNLSLELCQLDSQLLAMLTNSDTFTDGSTTVGMQIPSVTGTTGNGVSVEAWTKAWDGAEQAVPAFTTPDAAYFHWVFPRVRWTLGSQRLENGLLVVNVTGVGEENSNITQNGPFDDWPTAVSSDGGVTRAMGWFYDDELPEAACAAIPVTSAAS